MAIIKPRKVALAPLLSISIPLAASLAWQPLVHEVKFPQIYASLAFSVIALVATLALIPRFGPAFVKAGLKGRDQLKKSSDDVSVETPLLRRIPTILTSISQSGMHGASGRSRLHLCPRLLHPLSLQGCIRRQPSD